MIMPVFQKVKALKADDIARAVLYALSQPDHVNSADWNTIQPNHTGRISTRYVLKTDDGAIISLFTDGVARIPVELYVKILSGESVDPAQYYFKQHLFFNTAAAKYQWLNAIIAFGVVGIKPTGEICYDAYMVK